MTRSTEEKGKRGNHHSPYDWTSKDPVFVTPKLIEPQRGHSRQKPFSGKYWAAVVEK